MAQSTEEAVVAEATIHRMAPILPILSVSSGRTKTYSFPAVSLSPSPEWVLEHHRFFTLEKKQKRSNVQDSDNSDFHIIVLDTYPYVGGG